MKDTGDGTMEMMLLIPIGPMENQMKVLKQIMPGCELMENGQIDLLMNGSG